MKHVRPFCPLFKVEGSCTATRVTLLSKSNGERATPPDRKVAKKLRSPVSGPLLQPHAGSGPRPVFIQHLGVLRSHKPIFHASSVSQVSHGFAATLSHNAFCAGRP